MPGFTMAMLMADVLAGAQPLAEQRRQRLNRLAPACRHGTIPDLGN
jgi:hypothetical protein